MVAKNTQTSSLESPIEPLLKLCNTFDKITLVYEGSVSHLMNPKLIAFSKNPKNHLQIGNLVGSITKEVIDVIR
ncbi:unnamed protein product [Ambrosiozyma monospora]|uniref:Unnamed protein product n=1 Tax=Ambrosiozyma monospora TaxID=43982 RepID=A0ACB5TJA3_AMBMO|nr:unnamed protein product [Ambrosiozyma monospora]